MASITLTTLWLTDAADLADSIAFPVMSKFTVTPSAPGEVRRYANGRLRPVRRAGMSRTASATLPVCDRTQIRWLNDHLGQTVLVRSKDGEKFYGVYFEVPRDERGYEDSADVTLSLSEVTFSEAV